MLKISAVSKKLKDFSLSDISFEVKQGEYFVLLGESGAGKSVLLEIIAGVHQPDSGNVFLQDKEITKLPIYKREMSLVYQDYVLFPHMNVFENIAYPLRARHWSAQDIKSEVNRIAEIFQCKDLLYRSAAVLSMGQAQRVALARSVCSRPKCLLLDEPLSSLDVKVRSEIRYYLRKINRSGQTIIQVTHDYEEAIALAHRIAIMQDGRISVIGKAQEILNAPKSEFAAKFIGIKNFFHGKTVFSEDNELLFLPENNLKQKIVLLGGKAGLGSVIIRAEDIVLLKQVNNGSARNVFYGEISDIEPVKDGVEIVIDAGLKFIALITKSSLIQLELEIGKKIYLSFKASAVQFLED